MKRRGDEPGTRSLQKIIAGLEKFYGKSPPPPVTEPLEMILWENVVYLTSDERRAQAFQMLKQQVGITPQQILAAPDELLLTITSLGIVAEQSAEKLRKIARIVMQEFKGDLRGVLERPLLEAKKLLQKFPSLGEKGAEKILLFSRRYPVLALESNGLRVLLRLGFGAEQKNFAASYKSAQAAVQAQLKTDYDWLISAHQLLRQHGKELCKTNRPKCEACPLTKGCKYFQNLPA